MTPNSAPQTIGSDGRCHGGAQAGMMPSQGNKAQLVKGPDTFSKTTQESSQPKFSMSPGSGRG